MGYFLNSFALRTRPAGDLRVPTTTCCRCATSLLGALAASDVPFDRVVRELQPKRDPGRHPLFQVLFSVEPPVRPFPEGWDLTQMDVDDRRRRSSTSTSNSTSGPTAWSGASSTARTCSTPRRSPHGRPLEDDARGRRRRARHRARRPAAAVRGGDRPAPCLERHAPRRSAGLAPRLVRDAGPPHCPTRSPRHPRTAKPGPIGSWTGAPGRWRRACAPSGSGRRRSWRSAPSGRSTWSPPCSAS